MCSPTLATLCVIFFDDTSFSYQRLVAPMCDFPENTYPSYDQLRESTYQSYRFFFRANCGTSGLNGELCWYARNLSGVNGCLVTLRLSACCSLSRWIFVKFEVIDNVFIYEPGNQRSKDQHFLFNLFSQD